MHKYNFLFVIIIATLVLSWPVEEILHIFCKK